MTALAQCIPHTLGCNIVAYIPNQGANFHQPCVFHRRQGRKVSHRLIIGSCLSLAVARAQAPGSDWAVLRLGVVGEVHRLVVDTNHFKGNFPESVLVEACLSVDAPDTVRETMESGERIGWSWNVKHTPASPTA